MKKINRLFAVLLSLSLLFSVLQVDALAASAAGCSMSNITYTVGYTYGQFSDVDESKWYGEDGQQVISTACRLGLMQGSGSGFSPESSVSLAEAITMAARLHNLYCGSPVDFKQGTPWYKVYTDYAVEEGIISAADFAGTNSRPDYTRAATRAEMAYIFANTLPGEELSGINNVVSIPDVSTGTHYSDSIFLLYRAGVLTGDQTGTFYPDRSINRASAAAILARVALPDMRKSFTLGKDNGVLPWYDIYSKGMWIDSAEKLEDLYTDAVIRRIDSFQVKTTENVLDTFYAAGVMFDFNVSQVLYEYEYKTGLLKISISYTLFGEVEALGITEDATARASSKALAYDKRLNAIEDSILTAGMTDREKCKAIHDYMIRNYEYDQNFMDASYSFAGLLDNGVGVCQGYAQLFYLLANRAGVFCEMLTGSADGTGTGYYEDHIWNVVYLDNNWYHIDVTFDDPIGGGGRIYYNYFLISSKQISGDHKW